MSSEDRNMQDVKDGPRRYPAHKSPAAVAPVLQEAMESGVNMARGKTPLERVPADAFGPGFTMLPVDVAEAPYMDKTHFGTMDPPGSEDK